MLTAKETDNTTMKLTDTHWFSIAKETYKGQSYTAKRIDYQKWKEFIESNKDYYTWLEETPQGKRRYQKLHNLPTKIQALAEPDVCNGYYELIVDYLPEHGYLVISVTEVSAPLLRRLLDMAACLNAYLLNNKEQIIGEEMLENFV